MEVLKHITEAEHILYDSLLSDKNKTLLIAPMKAGKTTFVMREFYEILKELKTQLIFISPKVTLIKNLKEKYPDSLTCFAGAGVSLNKRYSPVITTPDSLYKVVKACEEGKRKFYMVYDEIHEAYLNYNFRKKLIRPFGEFENNLCAGLLGLTATADNIKHLDIFKNTIVIEPVEKFLQSNRLNIVSGLNNSLEAIVSHVLKTREKTKAPIICRINDKEKINNCIEILNTKNIKSNIWSSSEEEESNLELLQSALAGLNIDFDILFCTSLIDVGVEINLATKPILMDFMNFNSTLIEDIQFIGRFRKGVERIDLITPAPTEEEEFKSYEAISEEVNKSVNILVEVYNNNCNDRKVIDELFTVEEVEGKYFYKANAVAIESYIFKRYIQQIIKSPVRLKCYLQDHETLNIKEIRFVNLDNKYLLDLKSLVEAQKEKIKTDRENFKTQFQEFKDHIRQFKDKELIILLTKEEEVLEVDKWIFKKLEEWHFFYHGEDMKDFRKRVYKIKDLIKIELLEAFKMVLNDEDKEIFENLGYKIAIEIFDTKLIEPNQTLNKEIPYYKIVYGVRKSIIDLKGKEIKVALSSKFKNELLEEVKKKRYLSKTTPRALDKYLKRIYTFDSCEKISSVKKYKI